MNKVLEVIKTPQDSVNDDSVVIIKIHVKNGDKITENETVENPFSWMSYWVETHNAT